VAVTLVDGVFGAKSNTDLIIDASQPVVIYLDYRDGYQLGHPPSKVGQTLPAQGCAGTVKDFSHANCAA
jgi:hypothetical protein